jgi:hypothetical protein
MLFKELSQLERANWAVMADGEKPCTFESLGQFTYVCEGLGRDLDPPVLSAKMLPGLKILFPKLRLINPPPNDDIEV